MIFKLFEDPFVLRERARRTRRNKSGATVRPLIVFGILCLALAMALPEHNLRAVHPDDKHAGSDPTLATQGRERFHVLTAAGADEGGRGECVSEIYPCSATIIGNVLLMCLYGSILGVGAKVISDGAELLLEIMNPSVIGGFVLPVLGAVPDAAIIVVSGLGADAQSKVTVGMGTLAGSTIMLLTLAWMASLWLGRCDLDEENHAIEETLTRSFDLFGTGVTVEKDVPIGAVIMMVTALLYLVIQVPALFGANHDVMQICALVGLIGCILGFIGYGFYQVFSQPANEQSARLKSFHLQKRNIQVATHAIEAVSILKMMAHSTKQRSMRDLGIKPAEGHEDIPVSAMNAAAKWRAKGKAASSSDKLFMDSDKGTPMLEGSSREGGGDGVQLSAADSLAKRLSHESTGSSAGGGHQATVIRALGGGVMDPATGRPSINGSPNIVQKTNSGRIAVDMDAVEKEAEEPKWKIALKSFAMLISGVGLVCVFSDPMCDTLSAVTDPNNEAAGGNYLPIPAFYVSFVVSPICSNASELVSSLIFAMKKKKENISMTYAQLYGAATMNNTLCLGVFLALVYFKDLVWDFSAEVTIILFCELVIGLIGLSRTQRSFMVIPVCFMYFFSLGLVVFLETVLDWK